MKSKSKVRASTTLQVNIDTTDALAKIAELQSVLIDVSHELAEVIAAVSNVQVVVGVQKQCNVKEL